MSLSSVNRLPIEYITLDATLPLAFVILGLIVQVVLYIILDWDNKIYSFFLGSSKSSAIQGKESELKSSKVKDATKTNDSELSNKKSGLKEKKHDESICREEVDVVMKSLGLFSHPETGKIYEERLDSNYLVDLFEEKEPTEDEVKAAFDVFDDNRDGFVDANELQKLLCALGLKEGIELANCKRMIRVFDENGDGRIDFGEFVKFMESSFC